MFYKIDKPNTSSNAYLMAKSERENGQRMKVLNNNKKSVSVTVYMCSTYFVL